jgi:hypothetical protein
MAKRNRFSVWPRIVCEEILMKESEAFEPTLGLLNTRFTFDKPVRIPGKVLPAGSYWFVLICHGANLNVVQVFGSDRKKLIATLLTEDTERLNPFSDTTLIMAEPGQGAESSGGPARLISWFYPGSVEGHQFIYYSDGLQKILEHQVHGPLHQTPPETIAIAEREGE